MVEIKVSNENQGNNLVFSFFSDSLQVPDEHKDVISPIIEVDDFKGQLNQIKFTYNSSSGKIPTRIVLVGLGKKDGITPEKIRRVFGAVGSKIRDKNIEELSIDFTPLESLDAVNREAAIEGVLLGNYRFYTMKTDEKKFKKPLKSLNINTSKDIRNEISYAVANVDGTNLTRELGNLPSNKATPTFLAEKALELKELGVKVSILEKDDILNEKMGMFAAVFQGSADIDPPKFIIMEYAPEKFDKTIVLIGKAITFDTGGVSIKPSANMGNMISDMCGGGAVIGAMKSIGKLKPNIRVIGLVPSTPNVVDGKAYRPGDVITSRSGKTVEVISTDAEGRMLLADALDYAKQYKPDLVFEFATLTGAIVVALGSHNAAYYLNEKAETIPDLASIIYKSGRISGDYLWQMPLDEDYFQQIKSKFADLKQTGGRPAGSITAALLLNQFTDYPWVHFDIAGTAFLTSPHKPMDYNAQTIATGFGVRFINQFIRSWKS